MNDRPGETGPAGCRRELDQAAGVSSGDHVRPERGDVPHLPRAEIARRVRLDEVVDARAPAADLLFGRAQHLESWNGSQQITRLRADALRMRQMAGIVVHD